MSTPRHCDPQVIFELADGALGREQTRVVRDHLEACPGCRKLYEKELRLSAFLGSLELAEPRSVRPGVAMALPTRPLKARLLWAALALAPRTWRAPYWSRPVRFSSWPWPWARCSTFPWPRRSSG